MITEDYVSFETAELLKEKGFDASEIDAYFPFVYYSNGKMDFYDDDKPLFVCEAVTLQIAMKWLREVHNIHIELNWDKGNQLYSFQIWKSGKYQPEIASLDLWRIYKDYNYPGEWDYEKACEIAIKYCLENLI